jgi:hypothetical protein
MRPIQKTISIAAATTNTVATSQTPANGVNLTLNGSLVTSGVATFTYPTQVSFTSTSNLSTVTFTVYGLVLNADGTKTANSEAVTGPNNTTVATTLTFVNVNLITVTTASTFTSEKIVVGGAAVGIGTGAWWPLDIYTPNQVTTISCNILSSGSATYSVEYTNEDIFDTAVYPTALAVVHPVAALTSASSDQTAFTTTLMRAVRVNVASGAGQLRVTVVQQSTA